MAMYVIQEAHCTENNMHDWRAEWGYQAFSVAALAKRQALYCLTILSPFKFRENIATLGNAI